MPRSDDRKEQGGLIAVIGDEVCKHATRWCITLKAEYARERNENAATQKMQHHVNIHAHDLDLIDMRVRKATERASVAGVDSCGVIRSELSSKYVCVSTLLLDPLVLWHCIIVPSSC